MPDVQRLMPISFHFWTAVRIEARATWGRFWWLWLLLVAGATWWTGFGPWHPAPNVPFLFNPTLIAVFSVAAWVPMWLCADLCSLRTKNIVDPHRERRPIELLARAVGRLTPFLLAELFWLGAFTTRHLAWEARGEASLLGSWGTFEKGEFNRSLIAWPVSIFANGLLTASIASFASLGSRRPRRWLIAPLLALTITALNLAASVDWSISAVRVLEWDTIGLVAATPNFWLGLGLSAQLYGLWSEWAANETQVRGFAVTWWLAALVFAILALTFFALTWAVAARRHRRHPHTASPHATDVAPAS